MHKKIQVLGRSFLVAAVSAALIGAGAGYALHRTTAAFFEEQTVNPSNVFSSAQIQFTNTPNGGTACTAGPGTTNNPNTACGTLVTLTNEVPGDSKLGKIELSIPTAPSGNGEAPVTVWLNVAATTSSALDTTSVTSGGLGLLLFTCYVGSSTAPASVTTVADCETAPGAGNSLYLLPTYPAASGNPCGTLSGPTATDPFGTSQKTIQLAANTALGTALISTSTSAGTDTIKIATAGGSVTCTGGNVDTGTGAAGLVAIGGPASVAGVNDVNGTTVSTAQSQGLAPSTGNNNDFLAAIVYLPTSAGNSLQNLSSTLSFTWTAEQEAGTSQ